MIDYREYGSTLEELIEKAKSLTSEWSNFDENDIGLTMLKLLAINSAIIEFYFEQTLGNLYKPTSDPDAENLINELLGITKFRNKGQSLTFRIDWLGCGPEDYVLIPRYTRIGVTAGDVATEFVTKKAYLYRANVSRILIDVSNGDPLTIKVNKSAIEDNRLYFTDRDLDLDSLEVDVDDHIWTYTENVEYRRPTKCSYSVEIDDENNTYILLPSDWDELFPSDVSVMTVTGILVNDPIDYGENCITAEILDPIFNIDGDDVSKKFDVIPVSEAQPLEGTSIDEETKLGDGDRCITLFDFERLSEKYPKVADAKAFNWGTEDYYINIIEPNFVRVAVVGTDGLLSTYMKSLIRNYLQPYIRNGITFELIDPLIVTVDLTVYINIDVYKDTAYEAEIYQNVTDIVNRYFTLDYFEIGDEFRSDNLRIEIIRGESRVRSVDLFYSQSQDYSYAQLISLGKLYITTDVNSVSSVDSGEGHDILDAAGPYSLEIGQVTEAVTETEIRIYEKYTGVDTRTTFNRDLDLTDSGEADEIIPNLIKGTDNEWLSFESGESTGEDILDFEKIATPDPDSRADISTTVEQAFIERIDPESN